MNKQFMILDYNGYPVGRKTQDNPYYYFSFDNAFEALNKLYGNGTYDIREPRKQLSIVELKTIIPYGTNPDIPQYKYEEAIKDQKNEYLENIIKDCENAIEECKKMLK